MCDRETAPGRKCPGVLVIAKGGSSPPLGGAGKPRNECDTCGQARREKGAHRVDGEAPDGSAEVEVRSWMTERSAPA